MSDKKRIGLYIDIDVNLRKAIKIEAAKRDVSVKALTTQIITDWLVENIND
jgi:hypothetical protein